MFFVPADSVLAANAGLNITGGGQRNVGETFTIDATLDTGGNRICVIDFTIRYSADILELKSSALNSPFLMATEQDLSAGSVHYQIGAPGCTTSNVAILSMSFYAKTTGSANIAFTSSEILGGDDGLQSIKASNGSAVLSVVTPTEETPTPEVTTPTPEIPSPETPGPTLKITPIATKTPTSAPTAKIKDPTFTKIEFTADAILDSANNRAKGFILSGTADAGAKVNIVIDGAIKLSTIADAQGSWQYILNDWLEAGVHKVSLIAEKDGQKSNEVLANFVFGTGTKDQIAIGTVLPKNTLPEPASQTQKKTYYIIFGIIGLAAIIGVVIFILKKRKIQTS